MMRGSKGMTGLSFFLGVPIEAGTQIEKPLPMRDRALGASRFDARRGAKDPGVTFDRRLPSASMPSGF